MDFNDKEKGPGCMLAPSSDERVRQHMEVFQRLLTKKAVPNSILVPDQNNAAAAIGKTQRVTLDTIANLPTSTLEIHPVERLTQAPAVHKAVKSTTKKVVRTSPLLRALLKKGAP